MWCLTTPGPARFLPACLPACPPARLPPAMAQLQHALLSAVLVAWASSSALAFLNLPGFPDQEQVDTICGDRVHLLNENGTDADECIFGTNGVRGGERGKDGWMDGCTLSLHYSSWPGAE